MAVLRHFESFSKRLTCRWQVNAISVDSKMSKLSLIPVLKQIPWAVAWHKHKYEKRYSSWNLRKQTVLSSLVKISWKTPDGNVDEFSCPRNNACQPSLLRNGIKSHSVGCLENLVKHIRRCYVWWCNFDKDLNCRFYSVWWYSDAIVKLMRLAKAQNFVKYCSQIILPLNVSEQRC